MNKYLDVVKDLCHYIFMKTFFRKLFSRFPSKLPIGMTAFDTWSQSIIDTFSLPNNDSTRFALATMILHVPAEGFYKPKAYFARLVLKSMSNQIAGGVMQDLKNKQIERAKAEEEAAKQLAEATAQPQVAEPNVTETVAQT